MNLTLFDQIIKYSYPVQDKTIVDLGICIMQALILVGGFATRLRPFTDDRPKALIPILNKPMIMHLIDKVRGLVDEVILAVNYGKEQLDDYFSAHEAGVQVTLHPESEPLGTGGAIKNAEKLINDTFLVFNGDIITSLNIDEFIAFHRSHGGLGTLALWEVPDPSRFGIISIDENNQITRFLEKPKPEEIFSHLINAGTYCLKPEILELIPGGRKVSIEREIFPNVLDKRLYGLEFKGYWFDAGTPEIYLEVHRKLLDRMLEYSADIKPGEGSEVAAGVQLDKRVLIGKNCKVETGAELGPNVFLGDGVTIGAGSKISDTVIDTGTKLGENVTGKRLILGRDNNIIPDIGLPDGLITGDNQKIDKEFLSTIN
jgi:mannose-1-phosphate guanylyltransferase